MAKEAPELFAHKEWLGQIQQVGLVVSPYVLVRRGVGIDRQRSLDIQSRIRSVAVADDEDDDTRVQDFPTLASEVLEWPVDVLAGAPGGPDLPSTLSVALPEHDDVLAPSFAVVSVGANLQVCPLVLISVVDGAFDTLPDHHKGWRATPHARLERLLRETEIPIGLLFNGSALRLVYAPRGESSGHLTFRLKELLHTQGRPMAGALGALLSGEHFTGVYPDERRLPALLKESRKFQNEVSTKLSGQVLEALWELLRGFQRANEESGGRLLADVLREDQNDVYGGLLSTLMRLVFILYAEDRGLMPQGEVYQNHYSLFGLFKRLQDDDANHPDTMDARFGAWGQMLALFRLVHDGGGHGDLRFPARHGRLFDPDSYPFLEGRPAGSHRSTTEIVHPPHVSDGAVFRILRNLLILDGERLSYRALDVEQIGSVYEAMMGFALRQSAGPAIAVLPKHIVFDIRELLDQEPKARAGWLKEQAEAKLTGDTIAKAKTVDDVVAALGRRVSPHTPHVLKAGDIYLQPTEERRRSGSHYTPRSLTAPIVATTFRPIFERLGDQATPEQILDLKVCDPAMGSGAFLVEACRLLADRLVKAWDVHRSTPTEDIPEDEDVLVYAKRLVAEQCLYGVDKNIFAADLAKLSLWLTTLARDHAFTFLDHALRHGDSLVGLSPEQIACFNWENTEQLPLLRSLLDERVTEAQGLRESIQLMAASDDVPEKMRLLQDANEALRVVRRIGDLVVSSFFEGEDSKSRQRLLQLRAGRVTDSLTRTTSSVAGLEVSDQGLAPFHWQIEFPEVFERERSGFDVFVGNPPFLGGVRISEVLGGGYPDWLALQMATSSGRADLTAYFFRRCFNLLNSSGTFGLVATNSIAQGDTRRVGLKWIVEHGGDVFAATKELRWPGQAAVVVSVVHVAKKQVTTERRLNGREVPVITSYLLQTGGDADPIALAANKGIAFQGVIVLGMGFTFDDDERSGEGSPISLMEEILRREPQSRGLVKPYLGGKELNETPGQVHRRYVIDFGEMDETAAMAHPLLWGVVEKKVKPTRIGKDRKKYPRMVNEWWKFWNPRAELYSKTAGLSRVLAISRVSDTFAFTFVPTGSIWADSLNIFASESTALFAVLQSRVHEVWVRAFSSSLKSDLRYSPTDCFENFPLPLNTPENRSLANAGSEYVEYRSQCLSTRQCGLTDLYRLFHDENCADEDVLALRRLHLNLDREVIQAYDWPVNVDVCWTKQDDDTRSKLMWPLPIADQVLGLLVGLNEARASSPRTGTPGGKRATRAAQPGLWD